MMQQSVPPGTFGMCISAYQFVIVIAGCLTTAVFGAIVNYLNCAHDKVLIGRIIGAMCSIGYTISIVSWQKAKKNFKPA
jgi:hypothetical protein